MSDIAITTSAYWIQLSLPTPLASEYVRFGDNGKWHPCHRGEHDGKIIGGPYRDGTEFVQAIVPVRNRGEQ